LQVQTDFFSRRVDETRKGKLDHSLDDFCEVRLAQNREEAAQKISGPGVAPEPEKSAKIVCRVRLETTDEEQ
jgi:hypothetical protein